MTFVNDKSTIYNKNNKKSMSCGQLFKKKKCSHAIPLMECANRLEKKIKCTMDFDLFTLTL